MEYLMGSFQQILMGATCLFAAFFFGSYLHNRPAQQSTVGQNVVALADPMESLFAFGKRDPIKPPITLPVVAPTQRYRTGMPAGPAIDPSELAPVLVSNPGPSTSVQQYADANDTYPLPRKSIVPDFSELASRFRNTPLDLRSPASLDAQQSPIHASERVHYSGTFKAPEMVIRQPKDLRPLRGFRDAVDQVEQTAVESVSIAQPEPPISNRWRVERPQPFDSFKTAPQVRPVAKPQFVNREPRQTIEDVVSSHSADWIKESEAFEVRTEDFRTEERETESQRTFATNPPQSEGWNSLRQRQATEQAAQRNRDLLDVPDPGNRFRSNEDVAYATPPEPDYQRYYRPSAQRQDNYPQPANRLRDSQTRLRSIQGSNVPQNINRQSNFDKRYEIKAGDTLQSISTRFYGTPEHYLSIYRANRNVLDRITSSPVGVVIEIPNTRN